MRFRVKLDIPEDMRLTARPLSRVVDTYSEQDAAGVVLDGLLREWDRSIPSTPLVLTVRRVLNDGSVDETDSFRRSWAPKEFERTLAEWRRLREAEKRAG